MTRYPHKLYIADAPAATLGTTGDWTVTAGSYALVSDCREEPSSAGSKVKLTDGSERTYSSMIYLPVGVTGIDAGAKLYVTDQDGTTRFEGEVLRFSPDQKHSRIWA